MKNFDEYKIHRRKSIRIKDYDYSQNGYYFITICTKEKACLFGEIVDGVMMKNELGKIVEKEFYKSAKIRKEIYIDYFIVMPNHIHGIIIIENPVGAYGNTTCKYQNKKNDVKINKKIHNQNPVGAYGNTTCKYENCNEYENKKAYCHTPLQSPKKTLGSMIRGYKGSVKRWANKNNYEYFEWQRNYHEHIIRNSSALEKIQKYIKNNPLLWKEDCYNHI